MEQSMNFYFQNWILLRRARWAVSARRLNASEKLHDKNSPAFTLIELLVVIAIIGLMASLLVPSLTSIFSGAKISTGVETVFGALSNARQLAATKNRDIEFRLIEMQDPAFPSSSSQIRAVQVLEVREDGTYQVGKARVMPSGIIISATSQMSSVCDPSLNNVQATASDPSISSIARTYKYRSFRFRPDGSINLKSILPAVDNYYLTLYDEKFKPSGGGAIPPANFATIQLEPATGVAILYRP